MQILNENQMDIIKESSEILDTGYDTRAEEVSTNEREMIDMLIDMAEELNKKIKKIQEEYDSYQEKVKEYYEPAEIDPYDFYGVSESDFH